MDRQSIIGFTEAELGLFVAILFLVLALAGGPDDKGTSQIPKPNLTPQPPEPTSAADHIHLLKEQVAQLEDKTSRDAVKIGDDAIKIAELEREIEKLRGLRSRQTPACTERNVAKGSIRDVTIVGPNSFQVGPSTYHLGGFLDTVAAELRQAKAAQCQQVIRVLYSSTLSMPDSLAARKALTRYFYLLE